MSNVVDGGGPHGRRKPMPAPMFAALALLAGWLAVFAFSVSLSPTEPVWVAAPEGAQLPAPADGALAVGAVPVAQASAVCLPGGACTYTPSGPAAEVGMSPGQSAALHSGESGSFAASVLSGPVPAPALEVSGNRLTVPAGTPPGTWKVAVTGSSGGVWMFNLVVD